MSNKEHRRQLASESRGSACSLDVACLPGQNKFPDRIAAAITAKEGLVTAVKRAT